MAEEMHPSRRLIAGPGLKQGFIPAQTRPLEELIIASPGRKRTFRLELAVSALEDICNRIAPVRVGTEARYPLLPRSVALLSVRQPAD